MTPLSVALQVFQPALSDVISKDFEVVLPLLDATLVSESPGTSNSIDPPLFPVCVAVSVNVCAEPFATDVLEAVNVREYTKTV